MVDTLSQLPIQILYQDTHTLVVQTHAGVFDKFAHDDIYGQFNMGLHVQDNPVVVLNHRAKLLSWLNKRSCQQIQRIHWLNQIHSNQVWQADVLTAMPANADAQISTKAGTALAIMTADCVPIALFGDGGIACVHAGWQGLASGVIANTVQQLRKTGVQSLQAVIGACIGQVSYEISTKLAEQIVEKVCHLGLVACDSQMLYTKIVKAGNAPDKCWIDIVCLTCEQLKNLDITIITNDVPCSYQQKNLYSYRAQTHAKKNATGRMATVVARW